MMITHSPKLCVIATFVILALAQGGSAFAQAKLTTLGADAQLMRRELTIGQTARSSPSLTAFRKTPLFVRRQALFAQTWTNPKTTVKYADNHSLNITMIKNPSVADGATHVTKKMKVVGTEPCKDHSDWTCATQEINLTADSSSFLNNDYGNSNSHIYPGAIFTFDNFYHGQYHEQAGERNPMTLVTDNPNINGSAGVVIENPSILTCRDAVATIYHRFTKDVGTESSAFDVLESSNSADLNMQISGGASGYGLSFSDAFGSDSSSSSVSLTIDARKSLYSISALPSEGGFFKDTSIENTPNLMVVSNVV